MTPRIVEGLDVAIERPPIPLVVVTDGVPFDRPEMSGDGLELGILGPVEVEQGQPDDLVWDETDRCQPGTQG